MFDWLFGRTSTKGAVWPRAIPAPRPEPIICEPVLSFVKTFEQNPKRFKLLSTGHLNSWGLEDTLTGERWTLKLEDRLYGMSEIPMYVLHPVNFITQGEGRYIHQSLSAIYHQRGKQFREIKAVRAKRTFKKERQRLTGVYNVISQ